MRVTRFMSLAEWEAFERGEILINNTDHFDGGKGGSKSVGFCFTEDAPEVAWRYLSGIVDADVWVTFEFPDNYLTKVMAYMPTREKKPDSMTVLLFPSGAVHRTTIRSPKS